MLLRTLVIAGTLVGTAGCMTVRPVLAPAQFIPQTNPQLVYVTYTDNSIVPVAQPKISGDSLVGTWAGLAEPVAIPFNQIQVVQAKQPARGRTRLLIAGIVAFTAASAFTISKLTGNYRRDQYCIPSGQVPDTNCY